ncbi:MAG: hypothetical protein HQL19_07225 [Candidatus Omnitrophica bacterium]|nr:hypothetical protein [Candidatus Omnitrophota bacterium]
MKLPVRSQSTQFFERYAAAEEANIRLSFTVYLLGAICVVLVAACVIIALRPRAVHYIPPMAQGGVSYPGNVPLASVQSFSTAWFLDWMNYTPETAAEVYARAFKLMTPAFCARIRARSGEELKKVTEGRIASIFTLAREPQVQEAAGGFKVIFEGDRALYMGKEAMASERLKYVLRVACVQPTESDPYGLAVVDMNKEARDEKNK